MKQFTSKKQKIGLIGEDFAEMFLMKQGFVILDRNFTLKLGEIDVIATKDSRLFFFEVKTISVSHETDMHIKSVSHETLGRIPERVVSRETFLKENSKLTNPFQNISKSKIKKLLNSVEVYLSKNRVSHETRWQLDGIGVYLDENENLIKIDRLVHISIF